MILSGGALDLLLGFKKSTLKYILNQGIAIRHEKGTARPEKHLGRLLLNEVRLWSLSLQRLLKRGRTLSLVQHTPLQGICQ